jgi:hypothetical protein
MKSQSVEDNTVTDKTSRFTRNRTKNKHDIHPEDNATISIPMSMRNIVTMDGKAEKTTDFRITEKTAAIILMKMIRRSDVYGFYQFAKHVKSQTDSTFVSHHLVPEATSKTTDGRLHGFMILGKDKMVLPSIDSIFTTRPEYMTFLIGYMDDLYGRHVEFGSLNKYRKSMTSMLKTWTENRIDGVIDKYELIPILLLEATLQATKLGMVEGSADVMDSFCHITMFTFDEVIDSYFDNNVNERILEFVRKALWHYKGLKGNRNTRWIENIVRIIELTRPVAISRHLKGDLPQERLHARLVDLCISATKSIDIHDRNDKIRVVGKNLKEFFMRVYHMVSDDILIRLALEIDKNEPDSYDAYDEVMAAFQTIMLNRKVVFEKYKGFAYVLPGQLFDLIHKSFQKSHPAIAAGFENIHHRYRDRLFGITHTTKDFLDNFDAVTSDEIGQMVRTLSEEDQMAAQTVISDFLQVNELRSGDAGSECVAPDFMNATTVVFQSMCVLNLKNRFSAIIDPYSDHGDASGLVESLLPEDAISLFEKIKSRTERNLRVTIEKQYEERFQAEKANMKKSGETVRFDASGHIGKIRDNLYARLDSDRWNRSLSSDEFRMYLNNFGEDPHLIMSLFASSAYIIDMLEHNHPDLPDQLELTGCIMGYVKGVEAMMAAICERFVSRRNPPNQHVTVVKDQMQIRIGPKGWNIDATCGTYADYIKNDVVPILLKAPNAPKVLVNMTDQIMRWINETRNPIIHAKSVFNIHEMKAIADDSLNLAANLVMLASLM